MPKSTSRRRKHLKRRDREQGKARKTEKDKAIKDNDEKYKLPRKQWT